MLQKIISNGYPGVAQAALDYALEEGIPCGGFHEYGHMDEKYLGIIEKLTTAEGREAHRQNTMTADASLIITHVSHLYGPPLLVRNICMRYKKPFIHAYAMDDRDVARVQEMLYFAKTLHIMGTGNPTFYEAAKSFIKKVLTPL
jgi:hypothetical protein